MMVEAGSGMDADLLNFDPRAQDSSQPQTFDSSMSEFGQQYEPYGYMNLEPFAPQDVFNNNNSSHCK